MVRVLGVVSEAYGRLDRVDEGEALRLGKAPCSLLRLVVVLSGKDDFCAVAAGCLHLGQ
mgnify:CR=1 FL=1